jgi:hypothetical protein
MSSANLSRRVILTGTAALSVPALPATASMLPSEDVLTRIEQHRACVMQIDKILGRIAELEEKLPDERQQSRSIFDRGTEIGANDDPRWTAVQAEYWTAHDDLDAIAWSFVDQPPRTVADATALVTYIKQHDEDGYEWPNRRHHFSEDGRHIGYTLQDCHSSMIVLLAQTVPDANLLLEEVQS